MEFLPFRQIHLDFHTPSLPFTLANKFDKRTFQQTLIKANVNSITLTGRCHHGHIYYDSKLDARHPEMIGDFLIEQIDACHEIGVRAPVYLTVGWDAFMADRHPEWLERDPEGKMFGFENYGQLEPGWKTLCFNTPYLDYLCSQITETMHHLKDKLDGLFFDIVWQDPCSCNYCVQGMLKESLDPANLEDRKKFARETEIYLKEQIFETVQKNDPSCPIFFNEGNITPTIRKNLQHYSHLEIESLPSGEWGYQHFPTVVRYAKNLGKEYIGMTGKFHKVWADFGSYKNKAALEYECFLALAHGAKCSIGDQMYPDGTLQPKTYRLIESVYAEVKKREEWASNVQAVTEIAILHPGIVEISEEKVDVSLAGAVNMLNELHYQFDIIDDQMDFSPYRLILLPDKITMNQQLTQKLVEYVEQGGKLLASFYSGYDRVSANYLNLFGINYVKESTYSPEYGVFSKGLDEELSEGELVLHGHGVYVNELNQTKVLGEIWEPMYNRNFEHYYSHFQAPIDNNSGHPLITENSDTIFIAYPLFEMYKQEGVQNYRLIIERCLERLLNNQKVITGNFPKSADVIVNHQKNNNRIIINVLHYIPERRAKAIDIIDEAIPLVDINVELDLSFIAKRMSTDIPTHKLNIRNALTSERYDYTIEEDNLIFNIPYIKGHEIIEIVYEEK